MVNTGMTPKQPLTIKAKDADGNNVTYKVGSTCKLFKLKKTWPKVKGMPLESVQFTYNGECISNIDTTESVSTVSFPPLHLDTVRAAADKLDVMPAIPSLLSLDFLNGIVWPCKQC